MKSVFLVCAAIALAGNLGSHAGTQAPPSTAPGQSLPPPQLSAVPKPTHASTEAQAAPAPVPPVEPEPAHTDNQAFVVHDGKESWVDADAAARSGYTIIDFSDDWTPFIFAEQRAADEDEGRPVVAE